MKIKPNWWHPVWMPNGKKNNNALTILSLIYLHGVEHLVRTEDGTQFFWKEINGMDGAVRIEDFTDGDESDCQPASKMARRRWLKERGRLYRGRVK